MQWILSFIALISFLSINITDAQQQDAQIIVPNAVDVTASPADGVSGDSIIIDNNDRPNNYVPTSTNESNIHSSPAGKLSYSLAHYPAFFFLIHSISIVYKILHGPHAYGYSFFFFFFDKAVVTCYYC